MDEDFVCIECFSKGEEGRARQKYEGLRNEFVHLMRQRGYRFVSAHRYRGDQSFLGALGGLLGNFM